MMTPTRAARLLFLSLALAAAPACKEDKPDRWADAAAAAAAAKPTESAPAKKESGSFNRFFPADGTEGTRTFSADKDGYAEAKVTTDGKDVALLAVTDLEGKDADKKKFDSATEKVEGFPVATFGKNKTMVLVKSRYQVSVSSQTLDHDARKNLIGKFDLKGLAAL